MVLLWCRSSLLFQVPKPEVGTSHFNTFHVCSFTFRKLVMISDVTAGCVSWSFCQHQAANVSAVHFDRLHGSLSVAGIKHHIAVDLNGENKTQETPKNKQLCLDRK